MDLCKLINILRKEEKGEEAIELRHDNLIASIKSEIELLNNLGISLQNFQESAYVNHLPDISTQMIETQVPK